MKYRYSLLRAAKATASVDNFAACVSLCFFIYSKFLYQLEQLLRKFKHLTKRV